MRRLAWWIIAGLLWRVRDGVAARSERWTSACAWRAYRNEFNWVLQNMKRKEGHDATCQLTKSPVSRLSRLLT